MVEDLKASQEKSQSQASERHAKEVEVLQSQADKFSQELSSSKKKIQELEKLVSDLQTYKEQAQVKTKPHGLRHIRVLNQSDCKVNVKKKKKGLFITYFLLMFEENIRENVT